MMEKSLPTGFKFDDLKVDEAVIAVQNWKFSNDTTLRLFREALAAGLPSTCIKNENGDIVAHCLVADFHLSNLWVDPAYRRQGLAKLVVTEQAKKMREVSLKVVAYVETDNVASLNLFAKKLNWIDTGFYVYWGRFYPNPK